MQENIETTNNIDLGLELLHVQSNTSFDVPANQPVIRIGKPNELIIPDINVSLFPGTDIVSRQHAEIQADGSNYYLVDLGSVNGTFLNDVLLEPKQRYLLSLGDRISLGKDNQVTLVFQYKQNSPPKQIMKTSQTVLQPQVAPKAPFRAVDKTSKIVGLALMVASTIIVAANTHVGIFVRIPGVLLCIAGAVFLFQRRFNRNWGWVLIALGAALILFTGNVFASINLFAILASAALFVAGYQLMTTGKAFNYNLQDLRSLPKLFKK
ncbi:FHA domain-containing protein [Calothrix sp. UHCC 0171]|uniref:FHA domain-containing protein n=1 Tax=Calothrix sp. UHCC 0171 TaxID=3110245 RepID=UPI002B20D726|nr:FHA domain-containing protein [Calothrix sp. UHCC 0171]MEA5573099.1 FHA domain-containing protein [Calothrix sp. UHCC 0171]